MWDGFERLQRAFADQFSGLSGDQKAFALLLALPLLFYFGKNSDSYVVNTVSALLGLVIVTWLVLYMFR